MKENGSTAQLISLSVDKGYLERIDKFKELGIFSSRKETMDLIIWLGLVELERKQPNLLSAASALKLVKDSVFTVKDSEPRTLL